MLTRMQVLAARREKRQRTYRGTTGRRVFFEPLESRLLLAAEINLLGNRISIPDGDATPRLVDHTDFDFAAVDGDTRTRTFTIKNEGDETLNLLGTPRIAISGPHADDFHVVDLPSSRIGADGGTTTFQLRFDPSAAGLRTAKIEILNDDPDESLYDFRVQGTGQAPGVSEVMILGNSNEISSGDTTPRSGDHTDYGSANVDGSTVTRTFTVRNAGTSSLELTGNPHVQIGGDNAADFTVSDQPNSSVAANGGTTTFSIAFSPSQSGARRARVSVANNDESGNEDPYVFDIGGTGVLVSGPRVTTMGPPTADVEEGAVHHVIVRFDNAIDHSTFTTADIVFKRGSVTIPITSVERVNNTTSRANFATQTVRGSYTIQIGPNIVDTSGNLMNQDGDSTNGESVDDRASSVFEIGVVADTQHPVVTSAHADKTSVMQGEIIELFWSAQDNIAIDHVALYLYQGAAVVDTNVFGVPEGHLDGRIAVGAENIATDGDGSFKWKVFGDLPAAEYRIKVVAWDTSGNPSNALPTDFKWVEFIVRESVDDDIKPTVALTSPHTGNFNVGDTLTIEGSASDASDISHVQVELYQGGLLPQHRIGIIHPGNIGDGDRDKVVWTIPSVLNGHILNGSNYKIKWIAVHRLSRQWHRLRPTNR